MVDGGGVGLLPALCLRRMAWVLFTLLTESGLSPSSGAMAANSYHLHQWLAFHHSPTRWEPKSTAKLESLIWEQRRCYEFHLSRGNAGFKTSIRYLEKYWSDFRYKQPQKFQGCAGKNVYAILLPRGLIKRFLYLVIVLRYYQYWFFDILKTKKIGRRSWKYKFFPLSQLRLHQTLEGSWTDHKSM